MKTVSMHKTLTRWLSISATAGVLAFGPAWGQVPVDESGEPIEPIDEAVETYATDEAPEENLSPEELQALVGPIALYPDDLLAIVLPASAYPLQIVQAARFLEQLENDSDLKPDEAWDASVTALLNYPEVIEMMNEDLEWTYDLGEAVVRQQADVVAAVEAFRDRAYAAGNLKSDEHQTVSQDAGVIEIDPVEEDVIYVPYYEPERVIVHQTQPVYHYYSRPYPVYYYPYPYGHSFVSGYFWGVTTAFRIGWLTDHLHVMHHSYWGHPYYGRRYVGYWYRSPSISVYNRFYVNHHVGRPRHHERDGDFWRPRRHSGAFLTRHQYRNAYYSDRRSERSEDGYRDRTETRHITTQNSRHSGRAGFRGDNRDRLAERRQAGSRASDNDVIRFRPRRESNAVSPGAAGTESAIRFRARDNERAADRTRPAARERERAADRARPAARERATVRRGFSSSSQRRVTPAAPPASEQRSIARPRASTPRAAPTPRISRPSASPRQRTSSPRAAPRPRASSPRAAPSSRAAPRATSSPRASSPRAPSRANRPATSRSGIHRSHKQ